MEKYLFTTCCVFLLIISAQASDIPFQGGEVLKYDIHYKYGLVMLKAGTANFKIIDSRYENKYSYQTSLDFKTTSFFDKIFKVRDTLHSHISENMQPLYHRRAVNEGNTHFWEELFVHRFSTDYAEVRVKRENLQTVKFDTVLTSNNTNYDMLNVILFICSLDYSQWEYKQKEVISTFVGKQEVNIAIRYEGQSIVSKSETHKYNTQKIVLDITDKIFNESKNAIEVWISDDKNHVPIKIKAKLKIGAAEVNLISWENLKYPLTSEIKIPVK